MTCADINCPLCRNSLPCRPAGLVSGNAYNPACERAEQAEENYRVAVAAGVRAELERGTGMTRDLGRKQGLQDAAKVFGSLIGAVIPAESVAAALLEMAK
jgi:hypothetical protein